MISVTGNQPASCMGEALRLLDGSPGAAPPLRLDGVTVGVKPIAIHYPTAVVAPPRWVFDANGKVARGWGLYGAGWSGGA